MTDTFNVAGLSELQNALDTLTTKLQQNIMRGALRSGAKVIQQHAKSIVPAETTTEGKAYALSLGWQPGALKKSIKISARLKAGHVEAKVKAGNRQAFYAHMVEFGTAAHWIRPKNGKTLVIGGQHVSAVYHPGARKNPFMRISADSKAHAAVEQVADYIRTRLTAEGINIPDPGDTNE
jgi:HK97 gp10 family phage protein